MNAVCNFFRQPLGIHGWCGKAIQIRRLILGTTHNIRTMAHACRLHERKSSRLFPRVSGPLGWGSLQRLHEPLVYHHVRDGRRCIFGLKVLCHRSWWHRESSPSNPGGYAWEHGRWSSLQATASNLFSSGLPCSRPCSKLTLTGGARFFSISLFCLGRRSARTRCWLCIAAS